MGFCARMIPEMTCSSAPEPGTHWEMNLSESSLSSKTTFSSPAARSSPSTHFCECAPVMQAQMLVVPSVSTIAQTMHVGFAAALASSRVRVAAAISSAGLKLRCRNPPPRVATSSQPNWSDVECLKRWEWNRWNPP